MFREPLRPSNTIKKRHMCKKNLSTLFSDMLDRRRSIMEAMLMHQSTEQQRPMSCLYLYRGFLCDVALLSADTIVQRLLFKWLNPPEKRHKVQKTVKWKNGRRDDRKHHCTLFLRKQHCQQSPPTWALKVFSSQKRPTDSECTAVLVLTAQWQWSGCWMCSCLIGNMRTGEPSPLTDSSGNIKPRLNSDGTQSKSSVSSPHFQTFVRLLSGRKTSDSADWIQFTGFHMNFGFNVNITDLWRRIQTVINF